MGKYLHLFQRERPEAAAGEAFMILEFEEKNIDVDGSLAKD